MQLATHDALQSLAEVGEHVLALYGATGDHSELFVIAPLKGFYCYKFHIE